MNKLIITALFFLFAGSSQAQQVEFVFDKTLVNVPGAIQFLGKDTSGMVVIVPRDNSTWRCYAENLPAAFKIDGLKVTFTGNVGKIPKNVRMMGTPLKLKEIWVSKKDKKKYKLKKAKYVFNLAK